MKIALILSSPPGYSETFFRSKIKGLKEKGHEVVLITSKSNRSFDLCEHQTHPQVYQNKIRQIIAMLWVFLSLIPFWKQAKRFYSLEKLEGTSTKRIIEKIYINATLLKLNVDWLHFGFATMSLDRELVAKAIKAKMAVSFRGYDIGVYPLKHKGCYQQLWKHLDKVHSISHYLLHRAYQLGLSQSTPYQIITPAVDFSDLPNPKACDNDGKTKIITIARLHYIKGIDDLLKTADHLKNKGVKFEWQVIGDGHQSDLERYHYHRYELGLEEEVKFIGKLNHEQTLESLAKSDLYVQTSLSEGFCNAVLEAQALGKLCVAFNSGALAENIKDRETGFLAKSFSPESLSQEIIKVNNFAEVDKQKISQQAQERVQKDFNLNQQKEAFNQFYI